MRLRTDDDIYRARLVYLGPPGYTLPVQLSYAQYGVFVVLVPLFMLIHYLFTFHFDLFPAWEIALAIVFTSFIFRHVDPDRPARMVIRTALTDWHTTREPVAEKREARLVAKRVRIRAEILAGDAVVTKERRQRPASVPAGDAVVTKERRQRPASIPAGDAVVTKERRQRPASIPAGDAVVTKERRQRPASIPAGDAAVTKERRQRPADFAGEAQR